ncbi:MAG: DUF692 domain-containing protein [bacterium]
MSARPYLGHGVGLRRPHWDTLFSEADRVGFVEILTENFMGEGGRARRILEQAVDTWPVVLHGTALSIGSVSPLDADYLEGLAALVKTTRTPWFSDHLCFSSVGGTEFHDLLPVPFTEEALAHVSARVKQVQAIANVPFLLENPSYYVQYGGAEMEEAEFLSALCERADCGLLLDVNNVYVNARNHGYDPYAFIDAPPLDRVLQIHMAGHDDLGDVIIDTHGAACIDPVLALYTYTLRKTGPVSTLLEWDNAIPSQAELLAENDRVRAAARLALGERA